MVVTDTSPLNYLILIGADWVLPRLYGEVVAPRGVWQELRHADSPPTVVGWLKSLPAWIRIADVDDILHMGLNDLGQGEREAIALCERQRVPVLLLMDEARGRTESARRGIVTTGTLGVLDAAAEVGLIDLPEAFRQLRQTTFYATPSLYKRLLEGDAARRQANAGPRGGSGFE